MEGVGARDVPDAVRREGQDGNNGVLGILRKSSAHSRLALVFLVIPISSCSRVLVRSQELVGEWRPDQASLKQFKSGDDGSRCWIELRADGTVRAAIPDRLQDTGDATIARLLSGEGNWELNGEAGKQNVELRMK